MKKTKIFIGLFVAHFFNEKGNIFCFELTNAFQDATIYKDYLQHNRNYVVNLTSQKSELFDLPSVNLPALHGIDPRRIDA